MPRLTGYSGKAIAEGRLGVRVTKDNDMASAPDELFNVTGKVMINALYGEVTVVIATTTTILLERKTSTVALCAATTITSDGVGTMYFYSGDAGAILSGTLAAGDAPVVGLAHLAGGPHAPVIFGLSGVAEVIQAALSGAGTGTIRWDLWYTPLEVGAKVVAAA